MIGTEGQEILVQPPLKVGAQERRNLVEFIYNYSARVAQDSIVHCEPGSTCKSELELVARVVHDLAYTLDCHWYDILSQGRVDEFSQFGDELP